MVRRRIRLTELVIGLLVRQPFPAGAESAIMPYYRLYHLSQSRLDSLNDFQATDDVHARNNTKLFDGMATSELWAGSRKIAIFQPEEEAAELAGTVLSLFPLQVTRDAGANGPQLVALISFCSRFGGWADAG